MKNEKLTRRNFLQSSVTALSLAALAEGQTTGKMKIEKPLDKNKKDSAAGELSIAILLYARMTALDAIGAYEILSRLDAAKVYFVGETAGLKRADSKMLSLSADYAIEDVPKPDVLLLPGGDPTEVMKSEKVLNWVRMAHQTAKWTTSVCTGALILGAAGLLKDLKATTHWATAQLLPKFGAIYLPERYVQQGKIITSAGVSAGIDMALYLTEQLKGKDAAEMMQLVIEYDPQPPVDSGSVKKARQETIKAANRYFANRQRQEN